MAPVFKNVSSVFFCSMNRVFFSNFFSDISVPTYFLNSSMYRNEHPALSAVFRSLSSSPTNRISLTSMPNFSAIYSSPALLGFLYPQVCDDTYKSNNFMISGIESRNRLSGIPFGRSVRQAILIPCFLHILIIFLE